LGHLLCLRVTEILNLRPEDFNLEVGTVRVQALKRQKTTDKVMGEAAVNFVRKLMDEGFSVRRVKHTGMRGRREMLDAWYWPDKPEHYLFPASRRDSSRVNRGKDVVAKAIRNARRSFRIPHIPEVNPTRIRSHSGRHRCINDMKHHNVDKEVGKKYARISDDGVYQNYGKLSAQQAGKKLKLNQELQTFWKNMYVPEAPPAQDAA
jgi:integrase